MTYFLFAMAVQNDDQARQLDELWEEHEGTHLFQSW
jgi:hypothetical protein